MVKRAVCITISVIAALVVAAGIGVLIWWLVVLRHSFTIIALNRLGDVEQTAAMTRITRTGDMFWWFYPSTAATAAAARPIILWLDGVTGLPPTMLANFGMFGPFDFNMNRRADSWIDEYNLLFVDAPLGTGFSTAFRAGSYPTNLDENTDHLLLTLEAFYSLQEDFQDAPLFIFGQGHGAQLALSLAIRLHENDGLRFSHNLKGVTLVNGIVAPSLALKKLGFYLEEMGYIDGRGRAAVEYFSEESNTLTNNNNVEEAFDHFLTLGDFINQNAGAVAVNLGHIVEKMTRHDSTPEDYFGQKHYLQDMVRNNVNFTHFMLDTVAPALGIVTFSHDDQREAATQALRSTFMVPAIDKVEEILQNTDLTVSIVNGNLDAVSNTPGQLEWVDNLEWPGQSAFVASPRVTLVVNGLVEGYFRETDRLKFYWMNAAGQSVPLDTPGPMRRILQRITDTPAARLWKAKKNK